MGGVKVNLQDAKAVESAALEMEKKFSTRGLRFFVQEYMPGGKEVIIGAKAEEGLGHTVMFGLGGVMVELMKDVSFELTPIAYGEAKQMLTSIKSYPLLSGFRGQERVDQGKLIEIIQRVSQLVTELPMIQEMDLNPIIAYENRAVVVDARILI
jgi:acetyltransferase